MRIGSSSNLQDSKTSSRLPLTVIQQRGSAFDQPALSSLWLGVSREGFEEQDYLGSVVRTNTVLYLVTPTNFPNLGNEILTNERHETW